jgi:hypothetical protein
MGYPLWNL